jgi:hypothetical protein
MMRVASRRPPAAILGGLDQLFDLGRGQIFAAAHLGVGYAPGRLLLDLPVFVAWLDQLQLRNHWEIPRSRQSTYRITTNSDNSSSAFTTLAAVIAATGL